MQVLGHIDIGPVVEVGAVDEVDDSSVRLQQVAGTDVAVRGGRRPARPALVEEHRVTAVQRPVRITVARSSD